jgi:hypothetical protein
MFADEWVPNQMDKNVYIFRIINIFGANNLSKFAKYIKKFFKEVWWTIYKVCVLIVTYDRLGCYVTSKHGAVSNKMGR